MSNKPIYLRRKKGVSLLYLILFVCIIFAGWYFAKNDTSWQETLLDSSLKNKDFQAKVEEIVSPKAQIKAFYMHNNGNINAISFTFAQAGNAYDIQGKEGIVNILVQTLKEGTKNYSADQLREKMRTQGIKIGFQADNDNLYGSMTFPNSAQDEAVKILHEILNFPKFEKQYVKTAINNTIKTLSYIKEDLPSELDINFNKMIYKDFVYGNNPLGNIQSLSSISSRDLQNFTKKTLGKNKLYIGMIGNFDKITAENIIDEIFADIPDVPQQDIGLPTINWQEAPLQIARDNAAQNIINYAAIGTCRQCADFYPLFIANYLFGGAGLNSRLNASIREQEGLTYSASSWLEINDKSNLLRISFSATEENMPKAKELLHKIWKEIGEKGFSQSELDNAKNYLISSHNLRFASTKGISSMLAYMQQNKLGIDFLSKRNTYVNNVTLEQLNNIAKKYFNNDLLIAEIGVFNN